MRAAQGIHVILLAFCTLPGTPNVNSSGALEDNTRSSMPMGFTRNSRASAETLVSDQGYSEREDLALLKLRLVSEKVDSSSQPANTAFVHNVSKADFRTPD